MPRHPVPRVLGGTADISVRRVAEFAEGWTAGGPPPEPVGGMVEKVQAAWKEAGRGTKARIIASAYFSQ